MAFLIILAVLLVINLLPIGARVLFDEDGLKVKLVFGLLSFRLLPKKDKLPKEKTEEQLLEEKRKKAEKKAVAKKKKEQKALLRKQKPKAKKSIGAMIDLYLPLVKTSVQALSALRWQFHIWKLKLKLTFGGKDSAEAANNYGIACAVVGTTEAILRRNLHLHRYCVEPEIDYSCNQILVSADAIITITIGGLLYFLLKYGVRALKDITRIKNYEKAVQNNESSSS